MNFNNPVLQKGPKPISWLTVFTILCFTFVLVMILAKPKSDFGAIQPPAQSVDAKFPMLDETTGTLMLTSRIYPGWFPVQKGKAAQDPKLGFIAAIRFGVSSHGTNPVPELETGVAFVPDQLQDRMTLFELENGDLEVKVCEPYLDGKPTNTFFVIEARRQRR